MVVKFTHNTINDFINESVKNTESVKDILLKRIPFLKEYNVIDHPRDKQRLECQLVVFNENVKVFMGDEIVTFPQYNVSSEVIYYPHTIRDNTFHNFIIKNNFYVMKPNDMDELTYKVYIVAKKILEEKLSYKKEIMINKEEDLPKETLDKIINDMNGCLFKIEEFTNNHSLNLYK